ncbi:hypothetical protein [Massilia consociata]|uniref:Uncharacterized protein n=1 Tax=Massilia consociata TaxID=760117 RepID=A0ABV6FEF1_9BURK
MQTTHMIKSLVVFALALVFSSQDAVACTPLPGDRYAMTEKRVKERFASVDSVELVTLQRVDIVKVKSGGIDFEMDAERAVFRVDRVYKGKSKPGDILVFTSYSSCAFSVVGNPRFETIFDPSTNKPFVPSKQWLIYRDAARKTEITGSDLTRPVNLAWFDVEVLDRIARRPR